jgi:transcriptional regulator with XRE-family HTH domain
MFYERLKEACADKGTTPTALAKKLGISTGNTGRWDKGKVPGGEILFMMSEELGVTSDYLLGIDKPVAQEEQPAIFKTLFKEVSDFSEEEAAKVQEFARFVRQQRKQEPSPPPQG